MYIRKFSDGIPYTQECGPNCEFLTILKKGEVGDMGSGFIKMKGPTWNKPAAHDKWNQFYIILKGNGIMQIGDEKYPVTGPSVVMIPFNTLHALEVEEGEEVEYIYVNQHLKENI